MSQAQLIPEVFSPSVSLHAGRPATTSLEVANFFGKRRDNICRDIRGLIESTPENFRALNFEETFRTIPGPNNSERQETYFILYRDGFMLLVMGYTGKKALAMKLAYIEAFNRMEEELARQKEAARNITQDIVDFPGTLSLTPSTTEDRKPLRALVGSWAQVSGLPFAACWNQLKAAFQLANIRDLPQEWIPDALAWVQAKIDALPKALPPQPERLPLYRNGAFHLPPANNPAHKPGPQEEALMALWKEWGSRTRELEQLFNSLSRDLDACRGKTFAYAISDLGRHADTAFSTDAMLEGLHASQDTACDLFRQALHSMSRQLLLSLNVAVAMGR